MLVALFVFFTAQHNILTVPCVMRSPYVLSYNDIKSLTMSCTTILSPLPTTHPTYHLPSLSSHILGGRPRAVPRPLPKRYTHRQQCTCIIPYNWSWRKKEDALSMEGHEGEEDRDDGQQARRKQKGDSWKSSRRWLGSEEAQKPHRGLPASPQEVREL